MKCKRVKTFKYNPKTNHSYCESCGGWEAKKSEHFNLIGKKIVKYLDSDCIKKQLDIFNNELSIRKNKNKK